MSILRVLEGIAIDTLPTVCAAIEFFFTEDRKLCDETNSDEPFSDPKQKDGSFLTMDF